MSFRSIKSVVIGCAAALLWASLPTPLGLAEDTSTPAQSAPKKKKKKKVKAEPTEPQDQPAPVETTKIEPNFAYRAASLAPVKESVYHSPDHTNFTDQFYMTLRFERTYNYVNEVVIEPTLRTARNHPAVWDPYVIEQGYIDSAVSQHVQLTAGKKNEYTGSGFFVNPSDLLNEDKDLFDPFYQKEGVIFTRVRYHTDKWGLGLGYIPQRQQTAQKGRAWLTANADVFDFTINAQATSQEAEKTTTGLSVQRFLNDSFELHFDGRYQARQRDPQAEGQEYLRYSAYIGNSVQDRWDDLPSGFYLGGTRIIFTPRRTFILEAMQNQSGLMPDDFRRMYQVFAQEKADSNNSEVRLPPTKIIGRHYAFLSYQDDDSVVGTHLEGDYLINTDDKSTFSTLSIRYALSPITSIEFAPTFFAGKANTEFGEMPFSQMDYIVFRGRF